MRSSTLFLLCLPFAACTPTSDATDDTDVLADTDDAKDTEHDTEDNQPTSCTTRSETDMDADGTVDTVRIDTTDAKGRTVETDTNGDGVIDVLTELKTREGIPGWDQREVFSMPGRVLTQSFHTFYDAEGRRIRMESDSDGDGTIESKTLFYYDETSGDLTKTSIEDDLNDDGTLDAVTTTFLDSEGRTTRWEQDGSDEGDELDRWELYTYDGLSTEHGSFTQDEGYQSGEITVVDAQGHLLSISRDNDGDGTYNSEQDELITMSYDANGLQEWERYDSRPPDGEWDSETAWTYTGAGTVSTVVGRTRAGVIQFQQRWTYDERGNATSQEDDGDGDDEYEWLDSTTYDAKDRITDQQHRYNGDLHFRQSFVYDDAKRLTHSETDEDGDAAPDRISETTLDQWDRPVLSEEDNDGDGTFDYRVRTSYSCDGN